MKRFWSDNVDACRLSHVPTSDLASIPDEETNKFIRSLTTEDTHIGGYYDYGQKAWTWSDGSAWNYTNWVENPGMNQFTQIVKDGEWTTIKEISSTNWKRYWRGSVCQYD